MNKNIFYFLFSVLVIFGSFFVTHTAYAATIYSNYSTGDDSTGDGSIGSPYKTFHKAYTTAAASGDTLNLTGTFTWTNADETGDATTSGYTLNKNLTITGQGLATIIQAHSSQNTADRRVFTVASGKTVTIQNITIRHGKADTGGGISTDYSAATVNLQNCSIENNNAYGTTGSGGGFFTSNGSSIVTIDNCSIKNNTATKSNAGNSYGGGLYLRATATITNSTISGNTVGVWGSGIYGYYLSLTVTNSTISGNTGWGAGLEMTNFTNGYLYLTNTTIAYNLNNGLYGYATYAGVSLDGVTNIYVKNNIIAENIGGGNTQRDWYRSGGTISANSNNIIETQSGSDFTNGVSGNIVGVQGSLNLSSSLADNSTSNLTQTLALSSGSVAINVGTSVANGSVNIPSSDQRGFSRNGTTDIGAYEFQADTTPPTITNISSDKANGSYTTGEVIDIDVTFSEAVTSTGNVTITLETGDTDRTCTFTVTSSTAGTCNYTVVSGDTSSDLTVFSISGTVNDTSSNTMINFVPTTNLAANKNIVIDTTNAIVSSIVATPATTTSVITWTTDEITSSIVDYGLTNSYGTSTSETDTSPRVTSHSVSLSSLVSCSTYHYRVRSKDVALNTTTSSGSTFTTTGCVGSATVNDQTVTSVTTAGGGSSVLTSGSTGITLNVPIGATSTDAVFQIKSLNQDDVFLVSSTPNGVVKAGNYAFDLKSLTAVDTLVSTFLEPIEIVLTYQDSDVVGLVESSLVIYRWDGSIWNALIGCVVDTTLNTVTCTTSNFSVFSLFGSSIPATVSSAPAGAVSVALLQKMSDRMRTSQVLDLNECLPGDKFNRISGLICEDTIHVNQTNKSEQIKGQDLELKNKIVITKILKKWVVDDEVKLLQEYLNNNGYPLAKSGLGSKGNEITIFGPLTKKAVIKFQKDHGLIPDGVVGALTMGLFINE